MIPAKGREVTALRAKDREDKQSKNRFAALSVFYFAALRG